MAGVLGFQPASELCPSPSRDSELEALCSLQAEQLERLQDHANEPRAKAGTIIRPEEKQALVQLLSDLGEQGKAQVKQIEKMVREIDDLRKALKEAEEDIEQIRLYFPKLISEDRKRLTTLEQGSALSDNATVQGHITKLYAHMEAIGRKQVSFLEASKCLKLSKSRVLQFKAIIALDDRFIIVQSESHKQKGLIRLRKYYEGNRTVQPPN